MQVVILNGSPKADKSVSLQYVRHGLESCGVSTTQTWDVAATVHALAALPERLQSVAADVRRSDLVVWVAPVYACLVPSQLKRFIELIHEDHDGPLRQAFAGKHAAVLTTSTHIFDHTAHRYMHAICEDLGMRYRGGYSAEMYDLRQPEQRRHLETFFRLAIEAAARDAPAARSYAPLRPHARAYRPGPDRGDRVSLGDLRALVLVDAHRPDTNLGRMVGRLVANLDGRVDIVSLEQVDIHGGCLGDTQICGRNHGCSRADGFVDFYRRRLMTADIIVFAGTVHDRFLSYRWKEFLDRSLFHGHVPSLPHKQLAWLVSGPLAQVPNLRDVLEAGAEMQEANLVCIVTDEEEDDRQLDDLLDLAAADLVRMATCGYLKPPTFLGVAGTHLCRHLVERARSLFRADWAYYRKGPRGHDLPRDDWRVRLRNAVLPWLLRVPALQRRFDARFFDLLLAPLHRARRRHSRALARPPACAQTDTSPSRSCP